MSLRDFVSGCARDSEVGAASRRVDFSAMVRAAAARGRVGATETRGEGMCRLTLVLLENYVIMISTHVSIWYRLV